MVLQLLNIFVDHYGYITQVLLKLVFHSRELTFCWRACHTTIYWVTKPFLCLIGDGDCSLTAGIFWEMHEELWGIACTKDLMNGSKMCSPLAMAEVWCKDTPLHALPAKELACAAWRAKPCHHFEFLARNWCWLLYSYSLQLMKCELSSPHL